MDEKADLLPHSQEDIKASPPPQTMARRIITQSRFQMAGIAILFSLFWLATRVFSCQYEQHLAVDTKVPVDVHIMSRCPDAQYCLRELVLPTMANVSDKVDFRLSFIGKVTEDDGVECLHGPSECLGNIIMLCAASSYPDPKLYLGFTNCLTTEYKEIPSQPLVEGCALEHGLDFDKLNDCMSRDTGAYGMGLLRDSVRHSSNVAVTKSCTVRLNNKIRCIRDGGAWTDCEGGDTTEDLVSDIEQLYQAAQGWSY